MKWRAGSLVLMAATFLVGQGAQAQTCQDMVNDMKTRSLGGHTIYVNVSSSQANKIATTVGRPVYGGEVFVAWDGTKLTSEHARGYVGFQQFSDRNHTSSVGAAQNFSTQYNLTEYVDLSISGTGSSATIVNRSWNYTINIPQLTCSDGVMFGFGTPIGNANGGRPALYVISYFTLT